jgi:hypothetical protein
MTSRMRHVPTFTHAYDMKAREAYLYNHELNPKRYPLPKPHGPPPDRSAGAAYWTEGVTAQDVAAFQAAQRPAGAKRAKGKKVRFVQPSAAPAQQDAEGDSDEVVPRFSLATQVKSDLTGIWSDLQTFDQLPARTPAGKLRYMMTRGNRALSVLTVLGVVLLIACVLGAFFYFRRPAGTDAGSVVAPAVNLLGGAMPAYEDEWTRTFVPRTSASAWR